jgi:hypothetical protein
MVEIAAEIGHPLQSSLLPVLLFDLIDSPEVAPGRSARGGVGHTAPNVVLRQQVEMRPDLVVQFGIAPSPGSQRQTSRDKFANGHPH